ncbi:MULTISPECIES: hypothetical protein [Pseudomonas]|uniref:hypothetical protein n=1 Tax=Pseudomonas TaxID=286 RepID=UPI000A21BC06|nr:MULTISPECIES: hypothetical protein [Pseudomonas]OSR64842.1 hypothetical protein BV327_05586 [Pseudomonas syringae pv. actinidiae]PHN30699.1 hypothetical protein AO240_18500 [Pseudomonas sp. ICMP 460]
MKRLLLLAPILLAACGESETVSVIKTQVINQLDPTRTLGNALDKRERCSSIKWDESTDGAGRNVVTYTCKMRAEGSNTILQSSFDKMIHDTRSAISTYKYQNEMALKAMPCIADDQYSVRTCESIKNGKLHAIAVSEDGIKKYEDLKDNEIDEVTQIISWSVIKNTPPSAVMLSAKYVVKMDDGALHELAQGRETLSDVYINNESLNPVKSLARQLAPPVCLNCL